MNSFKIDYNKIKEIEKEQKEIKKLWDNIFKKSEKNQLPDYIFKI